MGYLHGVEPEGEVRILLYGNYRIAYVRRAEEEVAEVIGIFHGAPDITRYL